jgi:hypothetical protein
LFPYEGTWFPCRGTTVDEDQGMRITRLSDGSFINSDTGEIIDHERFTFIAVPDRQRIKEDWFMAFQDAREMLAKDREIWGQPRAILDFLESRLSFENFIGVEQSEIAKALEIGRNKVSEGIKKLVDKGIIEKGPKLGRTYSYKLNPFYGWKGRVKNLKDERKRRLTVVKGGVSGEDPACSNKIPK